MDLDAVVSNWPLLGGLVGLWFRLEVGMRGNRMKITELEKRTDEDRKQSHEDMREIKSDVKQLLLNQAARDERDKVFQETLKSLVSRRE